MSKTLDGWYFSDSDERLRYGDDRKIAVGVTHTVECNPVLCESGLHASPTVLDALIYAPGYILWRVTLGGTIVNGDDKSCGTERTYHARLDAADVLRAFARSCALDVANLWDCPDIVIKYLETGDESLRDGANAAALEDALSPEWSAAKAAAWSAKRTKLDRIVNAAISQATE